MPRQGQIRKRENGKYLARVYAGVGSDGKRHWVSKTFAKKKEAEAWLSSQQTDKAQGTFQAPSKETVADYMKRWLTDSASKRVRERTLVEYTYLVNQYVVPQIGNIKLADLRADQVQKFYNKLAAENGTSTAPHVHSVLRAALNQALKWGVIHRNVATLVDVPKAPRRKDSSLSPDAARQFLQAAKDNRYYAYFLLLLDSGFRPGEALALTWDDVDLVNGIVRINKALSTGRNKLFIGEPKTHKSRRSIPVTPDTITALKAHKAHIAEQRIKVAEYWEDRNLVFPNELGDYSDQGKISTNHFKSILRKAGLPERTRVYDLRHTSATLLMAANTHPKIVSERLGHSTTNLTLDTYSHVSPGMQEQVVQTLGALLGAQDERKTK